MGRIIMVRAFRYAEPMCTHFTRIYPTTVTNTPPTLLAHSLVFMNVLAPWISAKHSVSIVLAMLLVKHAPTMAFALRVAVEVGENSSRMIVGKSQTIEKKDVEVEVVDAVTAILQRCTQITELIIETRITRLFMHNECKNRLKLVRAIVGNSDSLTVLAWPGYLTGKPTFDEDEVALLQDARMPWREISLQCAFYLDDALFTQLFAAPFGPWRSIRKLTLTHSDITNQGMQHLPTTLQELHFEGTCTIKDAVACWRDLARCEALRTLSTYDLPTSTQALQELYYAGVYFSCLRLLKLNESDVDCEGLELLCAVCPNLETLYLVDCLPKDISKSNRYRQRTELDPIWRSFPATMAQLHVTRSAVVDVTRMCSLRNLKELKLADLPHLDVNSLAQALRSSLSLPHLQILMLHSCRGIPPYCPLNKAKKISAANTKEEASSSSPSSSSLAGIGHDDEIDLSTQIKNFAELLSAIAKIPRLVSLSIVNDLEQDVANDDASSSTNNVTCFPPLSLESFFESPDLSPYLRDISLLAHGFGASALSALTRSRCISELCSLRFFCEVNRQRTKKIAINDDLGRFFRAAPKLAYFMLRNAGSTCVDRLKPEPSRPYVPPFDIVSPATAEDAETATAAASTLALEHAFIKCVQENMRGALMTLNVAPLRFTEEQLTQFLSTMKTVANMQCGFTLPEHRSDDSETRDVVTDREARDEFAKQLQNRFDMLVLDLVFPHLEEKEQDLSSEDAVVAAAVDSQEEDGSAD